MEWCCIGFKSNCEVAGQRGSAVLVSRDSLGAPEFILQYRAVDRGNEKYIQSKIPASIVIDIRIVFCPWCGIELEKKYENIESFFKEGVEIGILKQNSKET